MSFSVPMASASPKNFIVTQAMIAMTVLMRKVVKVCILNVLKVSIVLNNHKAISILDVNYK